MIDVCAAILASCYNFNPYVKKMMTASKCSHSRVVPLNVSKMSTFLVLSLPLKYSTAILHFYNLWFLRFIAVLNSPNSITARCFQREELWNSIIGILSEKLLKCRHNFTFHSSPLWSTRMCLILLLLKPFEFKNEHILWCLTRRCVLVMKNSISPCDSCPTLTVP